MANAAFNWQDPFLLEQQLSDDERMVRDAALAYCQDKLASRVQQAFRSEQTDPAIFREMGALGLLGYVGDHGEQVALGLGLHAADRRAGAAGHSGRTA